MKVLDLKFYSAPDLGSPFIIVKAVFSNFDHSNRTV